MSLQATVEFTIVDCGECGVPIAIPNALYRERSETGGNFYCVNGHCRVFRERTADILRRQLVSERAAHDQTKAARAEAERAATFQREQREKEEKKRKRAEKRAACGLCPYCKRSFASTRMAAHVKTKHPERAESR